MFKNITLINFMALLILCTCVHAERTFLYGDAAIFLIGIFKNGRSATIPNQITMYPAATAYGFTTKINCSHCLLLSFEVR